MKLAYSIDQLVEVHPEGRTKIFEAIRTGKLKAKKAGRRTIVTDQAYRDYLDSLPDVRPGESIS